MATMVEFEHRYFAVTGRMAELQGVRNAADGELVHLIADAIDEDLWGVWGIHGPVHWVTWQTGMSPSRASAVVGVAKRRAELPTAIAALCAGDLALDAVIEIAKRAPAGYEQSITAYAKEATIVQLQRHLRDYAYDPDGEAGRPRPREETRGVSSGTDAQGWWCKGRLDPDEGAVIEQALNAFYDDLRRQARADTPDGEQPRQITMADALLALGEAGLRAGEAAFPGSDRYLVHLHLDGRSGPGGIDASALSFHLGGPVPEALRGLLLCDGSLRPTIWDGTTPVNVGRKTRVISRRMRRVVERRDDGCRVPGCGRRSGLEIHHITHWEHNGTTDTQNLITLCRHHHRTHHQSLLGICGNADLTPTLDLDLAGTDSGDAGRARPFEPADRPVVFTDRLGHTLDPSGTPIRPRPGQTPEQGAAAIGITPTKDYLHPLGETGSWGLTFAKNPPPDPDPPPHDADPAATGTGTGTAGTTSDPTTGQHGTDRPDPDGPPEDPRHGGPPTGTSPPQT